MIVLLLLLMIIFGIIVFLYNLGKLVKEKEAMSRDVIDKMKRNKMTIKYNRKNTPKVPTIDK